MLDQTEEIKKEKFQCNKEFVAFSSRCLSNTDTQPFTRIVFTSAITFQFFSSLSDYKYVFVPTNFSRMKLYARFNGFS